MNPNWSHSLAIPGSKSMSNRAILIASLAQGNSLLHQSLESEDTQHLQQALQSFGVQFHRTPETLAIIPPKKLTPPSTPIYLGGSGTGIRLMTAFASLFSTPITLTGNPRLQQRPIEALLSALAKLGVTVSQIATPPVTICGPLFGGTSTLDTSLSSQYLSALLIVAPYAQKEIILKLSGERVSWPYVEMTQQIMQSFGVAVQSPDENTFVICPKTYLGQEITIEADCSSASYFLGAAALSQGKITLTNWNSNSPQGDRKICLFLQQMGCQVQEEPSQLSLQGPKQLQAVQIEMKDYPDLVPMMAILAASAKGRSRFFGIHHLRLKESDRLNALATELRKCGIVVETGEDWLEIQGGTFQPATIHCYQDHRIAMSFCVATLRCPQIRIDDPHCVEKSFPSFWELWNQMLKMV